MSHPFGVLCDGPANNRSTLGLDFQGMFPRYKITFCVSAKDFFKDVYSSHVGGVSVMGSNIRVCEMRGVAGKLSTEAASKGRVLSIRKKILFPRAFYYLKLGY